jgi:hypothetical protein
MMAKWQLVQDRRRDLGEPWSRMSGILEATAVDEGCGNCVAMISTRFKARQFEIESIKGSRA